MNIMQVQQYGKCSLNEKRRACVCVLFSFFFVMKWFGRFFFFHNLFIIIASNYFVIFQILTMCVFYFSYTKASVCSPIPVPCL